LLRGMNGKPLETVQRIAGRTSITGLKPRCE
jgi:hypothetical protein